jgi:hypothetical protein
MSAENPKKSVVATSGQVIALAKELRALGFNTFDTSEEPSKVPGEPYVWYYDSLRNEVIFEGAREKGKFILTYTEACSPILRDVFGGLKPLKVFTDSD